MNIRTKVIVGYISILAIIIFVNIIAVIAIQSISMRQTQVDIISDISNNPSAETIMNATRFKNYHINSAPICDMPQKSQSNQNFLPDTKSQIPDEHIDFQLEGRNFAVSETSNYGMKITYELPTNPINHCSIYFYPDSQQITKFRNTVINVFLIIDGLIFIVGLYTLYYAILKIVRPIREINNSLEALQDYNFDQPITIRNNGELGEIQFNIRLVRDSIKKYIENQHALTQALIHETKSPITTINSAAFLYNEDVEPYNDKQFFFDLLSDNMKKIEETSQFALELFDSNQLLINQEIIVSEVINECLETWQANFITRHITISTNLDNSIYNLNSDLFKVIINNFLQNIYYHASENTTATITLTDGLLTIANIPSSNDNSQTQKGAYLTKKILLLYGYKCDYTNNDNMFSVTVKEKKELEN